MTTYKEAGVDIDAGDEAVKKISKLGFMPSINIDKGFKRTIEYFKSTVKN